MIAAFLRAVYLIIMCFGVPFAALRMARRLKAGLPEISRPRVFTSILVQQAVIFLFAVAVADANSIPLFPRPSPTLIGLAVAAALLALLLVSIPLRWKSLTARRRRSLDFLLPHAPADLPLWALVSIVVGVAEEVAYRGVLFVLLARLMHVDPAGFSANWGLPAAVCSLAFALGHAMQGWRSTLLIGVVSLAFHALVALTDDLYLAMIVHAIYDFAAGAFYFRIRRRTPA